MSKSNELLRRTKAFALRVIELTQSLPSGKTIDVLNRQLLRSGTSVGANYRAACRAKSRADFIAKMGTVEEEANESLYWLELLQESSLAQSEQIQTLQQEAGEILAMTVASIRSARRVVRVTDSAFRIPHSELSVSGA